MSISKERKKQLGDFQKKYNLKFKDIEYILKDFSQKLNAPVFYGYNISHNSTTECVPYAKEVRLSAEGVILL